MPKSPFPESQVLRHGRVIALSRLFRSSASIRDRIGDWIYPPRGPEAGPVVLGQRRVYILPTAAGLMFTVTLLLMLVGAINYNLALGFILTFLLAGAGVVSILHTWRNLANLALLPGRSEPVFVGEMATFTIIARNQAQMARLSLSIELRGQPPVYFDVGPASETVVRAGMPATARGRMMPGRMRVSTTYPLGLFHAWANVDLAATCLVYPRPEPGNVPLPPARAATGEGSASGPGEEDFAGLRTYHPGDSMRRIAWKAVARGQPFLTKQFSGSGAAELWLDYDDVPAALGTEGRISRLARWVIDAEASGLTFGLRLPGETFSPEAGAAQRERCLQALALYEAVQR